MPHSTTRTVHRVPRTQEPGGLSDDASRGLIAVRSAKDYDKGTGIISASGRAPKGFKEEPSDANHGTRGQRGGGPGYGNGSRVSASHGTRPIAPHQLESDIEWFVEDTGFTPGDHKRTAGRGRGGIPAHRPVFRTRSRSPGEYRSDEETISRPSSRGSNGSYYHHHPPHRGWHRGGRHQHRPPAHHQRGGWSQHDNYHHQGPHRHDSYYYNEPHHRGECLPPQWCPPSGRAGYPIPRFPHRPFTDEFGRSIYPNIPDLPSLLERLQTPYPVLPIPPPELLADLKKDAKEKIPDSPLQPPAEDPVDEFVQAFLKMSLDLPGFMSALKLKEFSMETATIVLRKLNNDVQVRFAERHHDKIVNRVHVVPRGRLALDIMYSGIPELDVDLIIPGDYILRRWNLNPKDGEAPQTVAKALGLDPASIVAGGVDAGKLKWVFDAVWDQLNGEADGSIFPGGKDDAKQYLPPWSTRDDSKDQSGLVLTVTGSNPPISVHIFVKVAISLHGQDMVVGVDHSSTRIGDEYQLLKVMPTPGQPLSDAPLSHTDRAAIHILNWWREAVFKGGKITLPPPASPIPVPGGTDIPTNWFLLALLACRGLDPSDNNHIPSVNPPSGQFSGKNMTTTITKILRYLGSLDSQLPRPPAKADKVLYPLSSCTIMDALYTQTKLIDSEKYLLLINLFLKLVDMLGGINPSELVHG